MTAHRLLLVGSNTLLWTGLRTAVRAMRGVEIVGDVVDGHTAAARVADAQPHAVLIERSAQNGRMTEIVAAIRAACPAAKVVLFSSRFEAAELRELTELGVDGFLAWDDIDLASLRYALDAVVNGAVVVTSRSVTRGAFDQPNRGASEGAITPDLTEREHRVLQGLAAGLTQQQIAMETRTSIRTVKRVVATLATKLGAPSPFVLGARASALGLVEPPSDCTIAMAGA